ncbi:MAG: hypothetical protein KC503_09075 [Myxococcales bacterium]|nr:hypothetical protein [Myxococcales bacterium]
MAITLCACALVASSAAHAAPETRRRIHRVRTKQGHRLLRIDGLTVIGRKTLVVKSGTGLSSIEKLGARVTGVSAAKNGLFKVSFEPTRSDSLLARMGRIVARANAPRAKRAAKQKNDPYAPALLDRAAKGELDSIAVGKRKAFVYSDRADTIAVGHNIHIMLAQQLAPNMQKGVAGFIERTLPGHIKIIHHPDSPVDFSSPELLRAVQQKLTKLGYSVSLEPRRKR